MRLLTLLLIATCLLPSCQAAPPVSPAGSVAAAPTFDGHARLGREVVPTGYEIVLTVDPAAETFHGEAIVSVATRQPTREVRMHAQGLGIWSAAATWEGGAAKARTIATSHGGMVVQWDESAPAGPLRLVFTYDASYLNVPAGVFRVRQGEDAYVFTQFEALDARRAFPCFDQPDFKTPFQLTLRVPTGLVALSNTPQRTRKSVDGQDVVTFARTVPLPTYLVAFAVGPMDVVRSTERPTVRVASPRGRAQMTSVALERAPVALAAIEGYFGAAYPFEKLDLVAVPTLGGAMENVGLVTFADHVLLLDAASASASDRRRLEAYLVHELAHSWFGNSVTLSWWDDLWLNEAFATWMQAKVQDEIQPGYGEALRAQERARAVMHLDAQPGARAVRQAIQDGGDVENAFDGITYVKGAALLRMVEGWVTPERFQRAVRAHVARHAYGHTTTDELLATLDAETGKPVSEVLRGYLDRAGLPWLRLRLAEAGERIEIEQLRATEDGVAPLDGAPWKLPVCVKFERDGATDERCSLLEAPTSEIPLPEGSRPRWVLPNAGGLGYYRWDVSARAWRSLVDAAGGLSVAERASLPDQLGRSLVAETLDAAEYLELLRRLAAYSDRFVLQAVMSELSRVDHTLVPDDARAAFEQYVQDMLREHVARVGLERKPSEPVSDELLRPWLLSVFATLGRDEAVLEHARAYTMALLDRPQSVDKAMAETWLSVAARGGDRALWERLRAAVAKETSPIVRAHMIVALGSFEDPDLLRGSLGLVLSGELRASDFPVLSQGFAGRRRVQPVVWTWVRGNYTALIRIMGESTARSLPTVAWGFCDASRAEEVREFFDGTSPWPDGTGHNLSLTEQAIRRCARTRSRLSQEVGSALRKGPR